MSATLSEDVMSLKKLVLRNAVSFNLHINSVLYFLIFLDAGSGQLSSLIPVQLQVIFSTLLFSLHSCCY